jgi:hypothetical protein
MICKGELYEHCKGSLYLILEVARDSSECAKEMVVYKSLTKSDYPAGTIWTRPLEEFIDMHKSGVKRFVFKGVV